MTTLEKNIEKLTNIITRKIGFTVSNHSVAKELLFNNKNSTEKLFKKCIITNGVCNATLIF
jgi:hypothetical protein